MITRENVGALFRFKHNFSRINTYDFEDVMLKSEFSILHLLRIESYDDVLSVSQIAELLHLSNPAISRTMKGLDEKEWIIRESDPNDRRTTYIRMSDKGRRIYNEIIDKICKKTISALKDFNDEDIEEFIQTGNAIVDALYQKDKEIQKSNKNEEGVSQ